MTAEQKLLLELMNGAVRGEKLSALPADTDWESISREAFAQGVPLLFFESLPENVQLPQPIYEKLDRLVRRCTAHNLRVEHTQITLQEILEGGKYPYVILKGQVSAAYYPRPELRQLGDVDFLLQPDRAEAVIEGLTEQGFACAYTEQEYHQSLHRGKEQTELHYEVAGIPEGKAGAAVRNYLQPVFEESRLAERDGRSFRVPCPEHHGLILLLHMQHHLQSHGMGLRHIMDWACFVDQTASEDFWQARLLPLLEQIGLKKFCGVMTRMCALYFGTACPGWAEAMPEDLCRELMEDLMTGGDFGRKDKERARSTNMLPDWKTGQTPKSKTRLLWNTLEEAVLRDQPELAEKPVRRMGAMTWKVLRFCGLYCVGKRPNLLKAAAKADARRNVYDRLEMFKTDHM